MSDALRVAREAQFLSLLIVGALRAVPQCEFALREAARTILAQPEQGADPIQREAALKLMDILESPEG